MSETATAADTARTTTYRGNLEGTRLLLKAVFGAVPIVAGADKFTNVLADWSSYLPEAVAASLPLEPTTFMAVVGVVEILAGLVVLTRDTEQGAALVATWLTAVAVTQLVAGNFDIAVRDLVMAVGAVALLQLSAADLSG